MHLFCVSTHLQTFLLYSKYILGGVAFFLLLLVVFFWGNTCLYNIELNWLIRLLRLRLPKEKKERTVITESHCVKLLHWGGMTSCSGTYCSSAEEVAEGWQYSQLCLAASAATFFFSQWAPEPSTAQTQPSFFQELDQTPTYSLKSCMDESVASRF